MNPRAEATGTYGSLMELRDPQPDVPSWTFLTNHAHVLIAISRNPDIRQRDIADGVGITEGAVQRIVSELEDGGYLRRQRVGRRNHYDVIGNRPLRHALEDQHTVQELIDALYDWG